MLSHLHLHLEPGERSSFSPAPTGRRYSSRNEFFAAHSLASSRPTVSLDLYTKFLGDLHAEQRAQGADYVELRLSPRRLLADGMSWDEFLRASEEFLSGTLGPVVRGVLLVNRDSSEQFLGEVGERVSAGLPQSFVGIDLAGDEIAHHDVARFAAMFSHARAGGLGTTVHAGEFGGPESVWRAIDELGATRIGHGLAAERDPALISRLARDRILLEISVTSNTALGAVPSGAEHPALAFCQAGIPVSFNSDVPLHTGCTLTDELHVAKMLLGDEVVHGLQDAAAEFAFSSIT